LASNSGEAAAIGSPWTFGEQEGQIITFIRVDSPGRFIVDVEEMNVPKSRSEYEPVISIY
jgi:hypothetical protein